MTEEREKHATKLDRLKHETEMRWGIDGLLVSTKHLTSRGQTSDQEAAVQQTFHLERSSFFYLLCSDGKNSMYHFLACILHTIAPNAHPDSCLPGMKPHPMKIIYRHCTTSYKLYQDFLTPKCHINTASC